MRVRDGTNHHGIDPPCFVYGINPPEGLISPTVDPTIPPEQRVDVFTRWVSRYNDPVPDLTVATADFLRARKPLEDPSDPRSVSTVERMTPEELQTVADKESFSRWVPLLRNPWLYEVNTRHAFFDTQGIWQAVDIVALWGDMSQWIVHVGARDFAEKLADPSFGRQRRKIVLEKVPESNHFVSAHAVLASHDLCLTRSITASLGSTRADGTDIDEPP